MKRGKAMSISLISRVASTQRPRALSFSSLLLGAAALLAGCAETSSVTNAVSSAAGSAVSAVGGATGTALGPDAVAGKPVSGTVTMQSVQAAYIGSGTTGGGTLRFRGRPYAFNITGAGIGGIGASTINATGEVYNLASPAQFAGTWGQARYGYAVGSASGGDLWLQNESGAIMHLAAQRTGLMLSLGADAMVITLK
jgi:hypothetical protein